MKQRAVRRKAKELNYVIPFHSAAERRFDRDHSRSLSA
jgi:hypothetical protein